MGNIYQLRVKSVDYEAKGISQIDGKTVFIEGALTEELVEVEVIKEKSNFIKAKLLQVIEPSPYRTTPDCQYFGVCGGCSMQHIDFEYQVKLKEQVLIDNLWHIGRVKSEEILPPIKGVAWGYRHRARLSGRYVTKKGGVLVGFREKSAQYVMDMESCRVLPKHISKLIKPLRELINNLSLRDRIPQVEVAIGNDISVLVLRNMENLNVKDEELIKNFVAEYTSIDYPLQIWLQPKGPDSCYPFYPKTAPALSYSIPSFNLMLPYYPTEFTQVNPYINQEMVQLAIDLLDLQVTDQVVDFFCGIGNFSLAMATKVSHVLGIEGAEVLVKRAQENAEFNQLGDKLNYKVENLFKINNGWLNSLGYFNKWLIDPPRDGAAELVTSIEEENAPQRIVYVSCNPGTLARDASILCNSKSYRLTKAGIMNMFPHTSHVESIAVFDKIGYMV